MGECDVGLFSSQGLRKSYSRIIVMMTVLVSENRETPGETVCTVCCLERRPARTEYRLRTP